MRAGTLSADRHLTINKCSNTMDSLHGTVKKKNGKIKLNVCFTLKLLDKAIVRNHHLLPVIDNLLLSLVMPWVPSEKNPMDLHAIWYFTHLKRVSETGTCPRRSPWS